MNAGKRYGRKKESSPKFGKIKSSDSKGIEVLSGIHPVLEALRAGRRKVYKIFISQGRRPERISEIIKRAEKMNLEVERVPPDVMEEMTHGLKNQGAAVKVGPLPLKDEVSILNGPAVKNEDAFLLIPDSIEDPQNLGALIRTALCSGVNAVMIPKDRAVSPSPSVSRASAGAMEHADICMVVNTVSLLRRLKKLGFWIAGLDAAGETSLFTADLSGKVALVIGGEHKGIRPLVKKECDFVFSLPMVKGGVTSLNASVAGGIAMYEVLRQRCLPS